MGIKDTPEWQQSIRMRPACDRVLCDVWGVKPDAITRYNRESELFVLDREFHIDLSVQLLNGSRVTGQEKALSYCFYKYATFTMEFYQNRHTKEHGEFFNIAAQFYLHGYSDEGGYEFIDWKVLDMLKFMDWLRGFGISDLERRLIPAGGSRASFLPIPYRDIPEEFVHAEMQRPILSLADNKWVDDVPF